MGFMKKGGRVKKEKVMAGKGLYANIHAKRKRGGKMRKKGAKGAPKAANFRRAKTNSEKKIMTKLCPRGKAAAKRKFKVYPSAYANAYASKICAGKIKDPSGVKRKDFRGSKAKGGLMGELNRPDRGYKSGGFIARGCGKIMSNRRKKTKNVMSKNGLDKWFKQKWVDIGSKRKDGSFAKCGRSKQKKDAKRKYPKCVPLAKATRMTKGKGRVLFNEKEQLVIQDQNQLTLQHLQKEKKAAGWWYD